MEQEQIEHGNVQQSSATEGAVEKTPPEQPAPGGDPGLDQAAAQADAEHPSQKKYIPKERFDQVYARTKDAELKLQQEREARARLEGELEAMKRTPAPSTPATPPRYTAGQLQQMIDEGKATVGQVLAYQEETLRQEMASTLEKKVEEKLSSARKVLTVQQELDAYKQLVPGIVDGTAPERRKVEQEFAYLVQMGYDARDPRTELMAARAALGSVETIKARHQAKSIITPRETMLDQSTSNNTSTPAVKDPLKALPSAHRQHYQKMIDRGVYKGWDEVREELAYVPGR